MFTAFKLARTAKKLRSGDEKLQEQALGALSRMEDPRALEMMIGALRSPGGKVRRTAAQHLSQLPGEHVTSQLIKLLGDQDEGSRNAAATLLSSRRNPDTQRVIRNHLLSHKPHLQFAVIDLLEMWKTPESIDLLIEGLSHRNAEVGTKAFSALVRLSTYSSNRRVKATLLQLEPERLIQELLTALKDSGHTRSAALRWINDWDDLMGTLSQMRHPHASELLVGALCSPSPKLRYAASEQLTKLSGVNVTSVLIPLLVDKDPGTRSAAIALLIQGTPLETLRILREHLNGGGPQLQVAIIDALSDWKTTEATNLLIEGLAHKNAEVRTRVFSVLIRASTDRPNEQVKTALLLLGPERLMQELGAMLKGTGHTYSAAVKWINDWHDPMGPLARIGDPRSLELMIRTLQAPLPQLRDSASDHLSQLPGEHVSSALVELLIDNDPETRSIASAILYRREIRSTLRIVRDKFLSGESDLQFKIIDLLSAWKQPEATDLMIEGLAHRNSEVRARVFSALVRASTDRPNKHVEAALLQLGPDRLMQELESMLKGSEQTYTAAVQWVIGLDDPSSNDLLLRTLSLAKRGMRMEVVQALSRRDDPRVKNALAGVVLSLDHENVRMAAWNALERMDPGMLWTCVAAAIKGRAHSTAPLKWLIHQLGRIADPTALMYLRSVIDHADPLIRRAAVDQYEALGDHRSIEPLIAVLHDRDPGIRSEAACILCRIKDPKAVYSALRWGLLTDQKATELVVPDRGLELTALHSLLTDRNGLVRKRALERIVDSSEARAIHILVEATSNEDPKIRINAVLFLLRAAWIDGNVEQKRASISALNELSQELTRPVIVFALRNNDSAGGVNWMRAAALNWLSHRWDGKLFTPLSAIVKSRNHHERASALRIMVDSKDPQCVPILRQALSEQFGTIRKAALAVLKLLPDDALLNAVNPHTIGTDSPVGPKLIHRLGAITDPKGAGLLIQALDHSDEEIRFAAAKALSARNDPRTKDPAVIKRTTVVLQDRKEAERLRSLNRELAERMKEREEAEFQQRLKQRFNSSAGWSSGSSDKSVMN